MFRPRTGFNGLGPSDVGRIEASDLFFRDQFCGATLIARPKQGAFPPAPPKGKPTTSTGVSSNKNIRNSSFSRLPFPLGRKDKLKKQPSEGRSSSSATMKQKMQCTTATTKAADSNRTQGLDITTLQRSSARKVKDVMARVSAICLMERERQRKGSQENLSSLSSPLDVLFSSKSENTTSTMPCNYDDSISTAGAGGGFSGTSDATAAPEDDLATLANWAKDTYYVVVMTKNKGIPLVVSAMAAFPYNANFLVNCCTLLTRLCSDNPTNQATAVKVGALSTIVAMMSTHSQTTRVQAGACEALRAFTINVILSALSSSKSDHLILLQLIEILENDLSDDGVFHSQSRQRRETAEELLAQLKLGGDQEQ